MGLDAVLGQGREQADYPSPATSSGDQTVEAVFEDDAMLRIAAASLHSLEIAVRIGLGCRKILAGENEVEIGLQLGLGRINALHLREVRAGDDGRFVSPLPCFPDEMEHSRNQLVAQFPL